ncbi:hypothetical protein PR048_009663, partial [Dryococelus australis]
MNDFKPCVGIHLEIHHVTGILDDRGILQFGHFASHADKTEFSKFQRSKLKIILVFFQGNAYVEGKFSISKEMLEYLVALRRIWQGIQDASGEDAIVVDREMLLLSRKKHSQSDSEEKQNRRSRVGMREKIKKRKVEELQWLNKDKEELRI